MRRLFHTTFAIVTLSILLATSHQSVAQVEFPNKLIKIVVPFPAGSGSDSTARRLAQSFTERTGQPVVVENRAGANGFLAAQAVTNAPPDGYTLLYGTNTTHAANPFLFKRLPYDPIKDFAPIGRLSQTAMLVVVPVDSPVNSIADLTSLARSSPGKLTFGSGSSSSRIAAELYKSLAKVDVLHVPYKGAPQALTDLLGRQIDFMFADIITALPLITGGKLRALAVTSRSRNPRLPTVPTMMELGFPTYDMVAWSAVFAPAGTSPATIMKLNGLVQDALNSKEERAALDLTASEPVPGSPEDLARFVTSELEKWGSIIKGAGIEPE